ncbi:flavin-binding monooxygenase-like protein [Colletotrichum musicola]|uniref:Flavin-binding monooxygenase-like protein n=1 Tax=Colletotrichum musicola TaxID=2175873 RepID=A0A8H6KDJ2_9PEZI|nr:flavin-binding monooxygenase-like protein [Colletotrichum musicola]
METLDFAVIGAGWYGLAAAKTHHQLHPHNSLAVFDQAPTAGGVWAEHRLYPGLKSNNMLGTYEYPDFPMDPVTFGILPGQHIPGKVLHDYLTKYAQHFGVFDKIRFQHKILSVEHQETGGWVLTVLDGKDDKESQVFAKKLVIATGLTSQAFLPDFEGQESFGAPIFHGKDFLQNADTLETSKRVTVFGGTKSAWDLVYAYATKGIAVNWVIRGTFLTSSNVLEVDVNVEAESGHGPVWMAPPYVTPLKKWLEKLAHTRALTWFSPCAWGEADGYNKTRNFYHGTAIGRGIVNNFWSVLGNDVLTLNKYDSHPELKKLKPWCEAKHVASSLSILNYETDFFDLIRDGIVHVHVADIVKLSPNTVHLSNGSALESDALACATGWKHFQAIKFLPAGIEKELGIPHTPAPDSYPSVTLLDSVDKEIFRRWPALRDQPTNNKKLKPLVENGGISTKEAVNPFTPLTPYSMYRFVAPPSQKLLAHRDIAFAGVLMHFTAAIIANTQALWIDAFFHDKLPAVREATSDPEAFEKLRYETALHNRFGKWRYPAGHGDSFPDFVFDAVPYVDWLLGDLGLNIYRKNGMIAEASEPYGPEDYKTITEEWASTAVSPRWTRQRARLAASTAAAAASTHGTPQVQTHSEADVQRNTKLRTLPEILTAGLKPKDLTTRDLRLLLAKRRQLQQSQITLPDDMVRKGTASSVAATLVFAQEEAGTAVCISPNGILLTCSHCVAETAEDFDPSRSHWLLFASGQVVEARPLAWDARRDLALLEIVAAQESSPTAAETFPFTACAEVPAQLGSRLICVGHPGSEDLEAAEAGIKTGYNVLHLSTGIFKGCAEGQDPQDNSEIGALMHTCWTYWGHSGAPLIERRPGKLVGLHSSWDDQTCMRRGIALEAIQGFVEENRQFIQ